MRTRAALAVAALLLALGAGAGWSAVGYEIYQTQAGDTPALVAARVGVKPGDLAAWNKISPHDLLEAGRSLIIYRGDPDPVPPNAEELQGQLPQTDEKPQGQAIGQLGVVKAKSVAIRSKRGGGRTLFSAKRGTQLCVRTTKEGHYGVLMTDGSIGWVAKASLDLKGVQLVIPPGRDPGNNAIVRDALLCLGIPYKYGGRFPRTTDCSGFVQAVFAHNGIQLPRTAATQFQVGFPVPPQDLAAGDRLYFHKNGRINHTGIYLGGGKFIHASSVRGRVAIDSLAAPFYARRFAGARRP